MKINQVLDKLNETFRGQGERKLVFWYDADADFLEDIDLITLDNASVLKLKKNNSFYVKFFLEKKDQNTNYLLYAPFARSDDSENHLLDMFLFSRQFHADKVYLTMMALDIPEKFFNFIKEHQRFFSAKKYTEPFAEFGIEKFDLEIIKIGMLSVIVDIKTSNFDEVLRAVITKDKLHDNEYIRSIEKINLDSYFWELCSKYYGYHSEQPTLEKLMMTMLITYSDNWYIGELPKSWQQYISSKRNDVIVFVSNFMNNILYRDKYIEISKDVSSKIKVKEYFQKSEIDELLDCDTFADCDELIIGYLLERLTLDNIKITSTERSPVDIANKRMKKYFGQKYLHQYECIKHAYFILREFDQDLHAIEKDMIKTYVKLSHSIDRHYRIFYLHYDQIIDSDNFVNLRQDVENVYTNGFLGKMAAKWAEQLSEKIFLKSGPYRQQKEFYKEYVSLIALKERVVVIISDAMRFEVGAELFTRLQEDAKYSPRMDFLIGNIPSYTKLGKGTLLPNKKIGITDTGECLIDDKLTSSTEQRDLVLKSYNEKSIALAFKTIMEMNRDDMRKVFLGKDIIYIYHNQIDSRGEHTSSENEVFIACEETIKDIVYLTKKLTDSISATNYIITTDHGFIYKRDKLVESDKVNLSKSDKDIINKRFIISKDKNDIEGTLNISLDYLLGEDSGYNVTVPRGVDIFKVSGGGQNYVHGGASLQEIVLPVITLKTAKGKVDTTTAELIMTSLTRKITNLVTYLDFMQKENISDTVLPATVKLYFIDEKGVKISNENIIIANKKNEKADNRMFKEKFTYKDRKYSSKDKYYLVMVDDKTGFEIQRHEFIIDIAFADSYGF